MLLMFKGLDYFLQTESQTMIVIVPLFTSLKYFYGCTKWNKKQRTLWKSLHQRDGLICSLYNRSYNKSLYKILVKQTGKSPPHHL